MPIKQKTIDDLVEMTKELYNENKASHELINTQRTLLNMYRVKLKEFDEQYTKYSEFLLKTFPQFLHKTKETNSSEESNTTVNDDGKLQRHITVNPFESSYLIINTLLETIKSMSSDDDTIN